MTDKTRFVAWMRGAENTPNTPEPETVGHRALGAESEGEIESAVSSPLGFLLR